MTGKGYCGRCLGQSERGTVCGKGTGTTTEGPRYTRDDTVQWRKARRQTPVSLLCVEVPGAVNLLCIQVQVRRPRGCPNLETAPKMSPIPRPGAVANPTLRAWVLFVRGGGGGGSANQHEPVSSAILVRLEPGGTKNRSRG
jgi:hypothetical protein